MGGSGGRSRREPNEPREAQAGASSHLGRALRAISQGDRGPFAARGFPGSARGKSTPDDPRSPGGRHPSRYPAAAACFSMCKREAASLQEFSFDNGSVSPRSRMRLPRIPSGSWDADGRWVNADGLAVRRDLLARVAFVTRRFDADTLRVWPRRAAIRPAKPTLRPRILPAQPLPPVPCGFGGRAGDSEHAIVTPAGACSARARVAPPRAGGAAGRRSEGDQEGAMSVPTGISGWRLERNEHFPTQIIQGSFNGAEKFFLLRKNGTAYTGNRRVFPPLPV
jgi:hypothetical protein